MNASWGLIGHGNIGQEIIRQISQPGVAERLGLQALPSMIVERDRIVDIDGRALPFSDLSQALELPDVTFMAIPSSNDGQTGYSYVKPLLLAGKIVVTAEKGALANNFSELRELSDNFSRFGVSATVGGGTRLLQVVREYCHDIANITEIHLALNGTLAAMMDWVSPAQGDGLSLQAAADKAIEHKYAEPGADSPAAIIKAEAEADIPKKLAIFYNSLALGKQIIDWHELEFELSELEIEQAVSDNLPRRFIVSLYPSDGSQPESDIIGGFDLIHESWRLVGGFRTADANPMLTPLTSLSGPGNGIVIGLGPAASDGVYALSGPGAGVNPTVNTMLDDFVRLNRRLRL